MHVFDHLKRRWGVGPVRLVLILLAFSFTGLTIVRLKGPVMGLILPPHAPTWLTWVAYLFVIIPLYHILLMIYGTLLGQFNFFWARLQTLQRRISGSSKKP